jgi:hypothetical protein
MNVLDCDGKESKKLTRHGCKLLPRNCEERSFQKSFGLLRLEPAMRSIGGGVSVGKKVRRGGIRFAICEIYGYDMEMGMRWV